MKNSKLNYLSLLFVSLISAYSFAQDQEIHWISVKDAFDAQKQDPKKILMDVYTPWCVPCKKMEKTTFINPDVVDYINENFYAVKFNAEGDESFYFKGREYSNPNYRHKVGAKRNTTHQFAGEMRVRSFPTILFFDDNGEVISPLSGYQDIYELEFFLKYIARNDYLTVNQPKTFNKYAENFNYEFRESKID